MRVFKTKPFTRFARKEGINDAKLVEAVLEMEKGLDVVDMGGGLFKKRVARPGGGKRGGYRTAIAYREGMRSVFLHGFPKNDKANLTDEELAQLKKFAKLYL
ncbi:MAG TPA: addiction module toxin RelE [Nitrospiraceae bacterium]|nr:addiction module toxin RelE [Nitrospiraceae bacterium]